MKKRILNKKGFSLAEAIIAMVIVSLVTVAAVTLFFASGRTSQAAVYKSQARFFAEDAFSCFLAADTADQFSDTMELRGGYAELAITDGKYIYTLPGSRFQAVISAEYPDAGRATFSLSITDADGEVIVAVPRFTKGA